MRVDLHMHSYCSDGSLDCKMLVKELEDKGIELFSLTDHDTIEGLDEMLETLKTSDLLFVPGVEIAATYEGKEYHLTTYGYDRNHLAFNQLLEENLERRRQFDIQIMTELHKKYEDISLDEFLLYEDDPYLGAWPSYNFLSKKGLVDSLGDYFEITKEFNLKMTFKSPDEVIRVAHEAGAKIFLAHPSSNQKGGLSNDRLDYFRISGIDGLECYSPYSKTEEEIEYYLDYCRKYQLMVSGGSDYHGKFVGRTLGEPSVNANNISFDWFRNNAI